jgi:PAS domain S-box-containing protein
VPAAIAPAVLLVDDRAENLVALEAALAPLVQESRVRLLSAQSADEALRHALTEGDRLAVVLLDVMMPGTDGPETARLIRQRRQTAHVPVIFVTALDADRRRVTSAYQSGAVDYLTKPLDPELLRGKVLAFVELHRRREDARREERRRFADQVEQAAELTATATSARASSEAARRDSEARLASIVDSVPDAIITTDEERRILLFNPAAEQLFGIAAADAVGQSLDRFVPVRLRATHALRMRAFGAGGVSSRRMHGRSEPLAALRADGTEFPVEATISQVVVGGRRLYTAVLRDATERVAAEAERERLLRDAEEARARAERLQGLTAALAGARTLDDVATVVLADMVAALGARTGALGMHDRAADALVIVRHVGFPSELASLIERQPLANDAPAPEAYRTSTPVWVEAREGPEGFDARYAAYMGAWDTLGVAAAAYVPLVAAGETVGTISFTFADPHPFAPAERAFLLALGQQAAQALERVRLFEAERAARAEAEEANRAKGDFLARMSHELRTPLNAIGGHLQLVDMGLHGPVTAAQREAFARIDRAQQHLLGLISDVLNFARLESGRVEFAIRPVRVTRVLADVRPMIEPQLAAKGLGFVERLPDDADQAPLLVWADPEKLVQVLLNLLTNAVKFTPAGGTVVLEFAVAPDPSGHAELRVRDTGVGIPPDRLASVFEPFVQLHGGLTRPHQGAGLGLAISRDLARGMGGDLTAVSVVGEGSAFSVRLRRAVLADGTPTDRRSREGRRLRGERRGGEDRRGDTPTSRSVPVPERVGDDVEA